MNLLNYEDRKIVINPMIYTIKAFKDLIDRDTTITKEKVLLELGYIYFMYDPRSNYQAIIDIEDREERVKQAIGMRKNYSVDRKLEKAISTYKELIKTETSMLLEDLNVSISKIRTLLRDTDLSKTDADGKLIFDPLKYTNIIKGIPDIIKNIAQAKKTVVNEIEEIGEMRGNKLKNLADDGWKNLLS